MNHRSNWRLYLGAFLLAYGLTTLAQIAYQLVRRAR